MAKRGRKSHIPSSLWDGLAIGIPASILAAKHGYSRGYVQSLKQKHDQAIRERQLWLYAFQIEMTMRQHPEMFVEVSPGVWSNR